MVNWKYPSCYDHTDTFYKSLINLQTILILHDSNFKSRKLYSNLTIPERYVRYCKIRVSLGNCSIPQYNGGGSLWPVTQKYFLLLFIWLSVYYFKRKKLNLSIKSGGPSLCVRKECGVHKCKWNNLGSEIWKY